jgi:septum formation topological specificity factor MinE
MSAPCAALTSSSQPEASRVTGVKRSRSEAAPPARMAPARRTVVCKASQHAEPMDRLLEACRIFLPGRTRSAARTARDRLTCVLSVDREAQLSLLSGEDPDAGDPRAALLLQKRVKAVLEEYVDLHQGGVASSALQSHVDDAGTTVYSMQFAVKRSKPAFC